MKANVRACFPVNLAQILGARRHRRPVPENVGCRQLFVPTRTVVPDEDFASALISQIATSKSGRGGRRKLPWAFTEHGAIQAANVLNSKLTVQMGVYVVCAFIQLRDLLTSNKELARRVDELEARLEKNLTTHDEAIVGILKAIRELTNPPAPKRRGSGFSADFEDN
jgi:hypothetical protein